MREPLTFAMKLKNANNGMRKSKIITTLLLLWGSFSWAQNTITGSIMSGGLQREYKIYVPALYDGTLEVPLIFNFHGYSSNFNEQEVYGDFRPIADTANFIVVHPNGTTDSQGNNSWNTFDIGTANDVQFIADLLDTLKLLYLVDTNAVFCTGMSNGGFMSYDLACQMSQKIAAIASVTGSMIDTHLNNCNVVNTMPVMQIHGTLDGTVPYNGILNFTPIEDLVEYWLQYNNCEPVPIVTQVPNTNILDNCTAEHYVYPNGNDGAEVEFYKIIGGGHSWPGAPVNLNTTNMDFSASAEIWRFFRKHKRNNQVTNLQTANSQNNGIVYPNPSTSEKIQLRFKNNQFRELTLSNALGQTLKQFSGTQNEWEITIAPKGLFFITIKEPNQGAFTQKVIRY